MCHRGSRHRRVRGRRTPRYAGKAERLAAIKVELGDCERLECALVDDARDDDARDKGIILDVRPNVSIPALLGIVVTKSKAKAA
jgi:hypothetical protein